MKREEAMARIAELEQENKAFRAKATAKLRELKERAAEAERELEKVRDQLSRQAEATDKGNKRVMALLGGLKEAAIQASWMTEEETLTGPQALLFLKEFGVALQEATPEVEAQRNKRLLEFLAETAYISSGAGWVLGRRIPNRDKNVSGMSKEAQRAEFLKDLAFAVEMHQRHVLAKERGLI